VTAKDDEKGQCISDDKTEKYVAVTSVAPYRDNY